MPKTVRLQSKAPLAALERLGLTPLEAEVYAFLASKSPASGYRVAQGIGKPFGSVYKAIEGLETKGAAILSEESGNRVARAVSISTVVRRAAEEFERSCQAAAVFAPAESPQRDTHLYRLADRELVFDTARDMLGRATDFALASVTPGIARSLLEPCRAALARDVRVGIKAFAPLDLAGADVVIDQRGPGAIQSAPGEWLVLTVDGREQLEALFEHGAGELLAAHWTENPLLAWTSFTGLSSDFVLAAVRASPLGQDPRLEELASRLTPFETPASAGKKWLIDRFRPPSRGRK